MSAPEQPQIERHSATNPTPTLAAGAAALPRVWATPPLGGPAAWRRRLALLEDNQQQPAEALAILRDLALTCVVVLGLAFVSGWVSVWLH